MTRTRRAFDPLKDTARTLARIAFPVAQPCEVCEEPLTQRHHDDYSKPLEIRWLCTPHHNDVHRPGRTHGTYSAYCGGCRCDPCRQAQRDYRAPRLRADAEYQASRPKAPAR